MFRSTDLQNRAVRPSQLADRAERRVDDEPGAVTPEKLAREWGVHVNTVYRDIRKGALPAFRLPSGYYRIRRDDARRYGRPVD